MRISVMVVIALALVGCDRPGSGIIAGPDARTAAQIRASVTPNLPLADPCPTCLGVFLTGGGASWQQCAQNPGNDADYDLVNDDCEAKLAAAFAPQLMMDPNDYDATRETYWVAQVTSNPSIRAIRIFYALAYHRDSGHYGDSEFIEVTASFDSTLTTGETNGRWVFDNALLSAHYHTVIPFGDKTKRYYSNEIDFAVGHYRDNPIVWVSSGKHANYPREGDCNANLNIGDDCSGNVSVGPVEALGSRNLGSQWHQFQNCVASVDPAQHEGMECFWNLAPAPYPVFRGWSTVDDGVTGYGEILSNFNYFLQ